MPTLPNSDGSPLKTLSGGGSPLISQRNTRSPVVDFALRLLGFFAIALLFLFVFPVVLTIGAMRRSQAASVADDKHAIAQDPGQSLHSVSESE